MNQRSKFLLVECAGCKNQQIIFNKPSNKVSCLVCGKQLAEPRGGLGNIKTKIKKVAK